MVLWDRKNSGKTLGLSGPPGHKSANFRPTPATLRTIEISKIPIFWYFRAKLRFFWIQNTNFHPKMYQNYLKIFSGLLWTLKIIYIQFWVIFEELKIWIFQIFCMSILSFSPGLTQNVLRTKISCQKKFFLECYTL